MTSLTARTPRPGMALYTLLKWPEPIRPIGAVADGDDLAVCWHENGNDAIFGTLELSVSGAVHLGDGPALATVLRLHRQHDIEALMDRYAVYVRQGTDDLPSTVYGAAWDGKAIEWVAYDLYLFVQAVLDYETGIYAVQS